MRREVRLPDEIIGRGVELVAIERFVERARAGLAALILEGEPGIGKTTLWEAGVAAAGRAGFRVLRSRAARAELGLTLAGLTDLLGPIDEGVLARLPGPQRHALDIALLRVAATGAPPDQRALSVAVAATLRELAASTPVLVAVDDAQWLDESSSALLAYALRRLTDVPVGWLATMRHETTGDLADIAAAIPRDRLDRLRLDPMPLAGLHRLLQLRLGRSFPRLVLVRIEAVSGGNPLYALEIARALGHAGLPADGHLPLPVPDSLGSLMTARVTALPMPTREVLVLAAAAAEPTLATLERARPGAASALAPAIDAGVVALDDGVLRFAHPLLGQAALGLATPIELRVVHAALATVSASPDARARHLGQAADGPDESVADVLATAAAAARDRGATLDAAALYLDAGRATPADLGDRRLMRARLAAECLFIDLSEASDADAILEAAIPDAPPGGERATALSLHAIVRYYHGRTPEAAAIGERALLEAGDDPLVRATVLGRLAFLVMQLDLERGLALVEEAIALLDGFPGPVDPDLLANALLLRAVAELALVRPTRHMDIERGLRLITQGGRSWEHEGADGSAFGLARHTDDLDRAIEMTRELIRAKSGPGGDDPFNLVQLSGLLVHRGSWDEARRVADLAMEGYQREGGDLHPAWGLRGVALVAVHQGRLAEARGTAEEGLRLATERGDAVVAAFHRHILGFAALSAGDPAEADRQLSAAAALAAGISTRHPGRFKIAGDHVEAMLALGDRDRAAAVVSSLEEAAAVAPTPWVRAVGARASAMLRAAEGDLDGAAAAFDRAILEHDALPMPFERARTLLAKGQLHRRRKEKRLADETLRAALDAFERLGAMAWAERARSELARVGRRPAAPESLTETERRVAELAADGLTGRQIAERLSLSPKTVGNVLGRVYEKLGIHSRAELGARMTSAAGGGGEAGAVRSPDPAG